MGNGKMTPGQLEKIRADDAAVVTPSPFPVYQHRRALLAHLDAVEKEREAIERLYTAMCDRLHDACVRHDLGLGGEHVAHLVIDALATLTRERAEWKEYAYHCERVLADLRAVAAETFDHWDADQDSKVGKVLSALDGELRGYDKRIDAFRAVFDSRPTDAPAPTEAR